MPSAPGPWALCWPTTIPAAWRCRLQEDIATTRLIRDALRTMNIQLVDHIVVADGDYVSMAASGMLI